MPPLRLSAKENPKNFLGISTYQEQCGNGFCHAGTHMPADVYTIVMSESGIQVNGATDGKVQRGTQKYASTAPDVAAHNRSLKDPPRGYGAERHFIGVNKKRAILYRTLQWSSIV